MYNLMPSGASDNRSRGAREWLGDKKLKKMALTREYDFFYDLHVKFRLPVSSIEKTNIALNLLI